MKEIKQTPEPKKRPFKDLNVLGNRIIEVLAQNGIWAYCHSVYERKDRVIKVTLAVYPKKVLEEKGMLERFLGKQK